MSTVLAALAKKAGPEDTRTAGQRRHDALQEACRRLITAGMVPGRAGQPTQLTVHMTLDQLLWMPGADSAAAQWAAAQAATKDGWLTGPAADAVACDATITPVVTGHLDPAALDRLTSLLLATSHPTDPTAPGVSRPTASGTSRPTASGTSRPTDPDAGPSAVPGAGRPTVGSSAGPPTAGRHGPPGRLTPNATSTQTGRPLTAPTRDRLRRALLGMAIQALSGPGGLAAHLRTTLTGPPAPSLPAPSLPAPGLPDSGVPDPGQAGNRVTGGLPAAVSLPLDIGTATPLIPAHLRKAAGIRHRHCAFPGCQQPLSACDLHHLIPRSHGGPTSLANLVPLCQFHHLTVIHRWGWTLQLHSDGTTTATSPDGTRTFHSHSPPGQAA